MKYKTILYYKITRILITQFKLTAFKIMRIFEIIYIDHQYCYFGYSYLNESISKIFALALGCRERCTLLPLSIFNLKYKKKNY